MLASGRTGAIFRELHNWYTCRYMSVERRIGGERESLIFRDPEHANEFQESFERRVQHESMKGAKRERELMGDELVKVFEQEGVGVTPVREPWEHSQEEHQEAQHLVDVAFPADLMLRSSKRTKAHIFLGILIYCTMRSRARCMTLSLYRE